MGSASMSDEGLSIFDDEPDEADDDRRSAAPQDETQVMPA